MKNLFSNFNYSSYFCIKINQKNILKQMKSHISLLLLLICLNSHAQTNIVGRVYHNPNIMTGKMKELSQKADKEFDEVKNEAIKKEEEKKKRKLTAQEMAEVEEEIKEGQQMIKAMVQGIKTAITITFKDEKTAVMKVDMKIDDKVMKAAGIGWAKRKVIQAACAVSPSEKSKYTVKGNMIILEDGKEKDTLTMSSDGKYLSGKMDEETPFKLTRTK